MKISDCSFPSVISDAISIYDGGRPYSDEGWREFSEWMAADDGQLDPETREMWDRAAESIIEQLDEA